MRPVLSILALALRAVIGGHRGLAPRGGGLLRWAALAASIAALHGCADLLGYGDYTFETGGSGGAPAGGGGLGGAAGSGGTAGTAGTGGSGGAASTCTTDADCAGSPYGEKCDPAEGRCVECLPGRTTRALSACTARPATSASSAARTTPAATRTASPAR